MLIIPKRHSENYFTLFHPEFNAVNQLLNHGKEMMLAKDKSMDASKANEGLLDWLLPNQIVPAVSNVIVNLGKGALAATPIQVGEGWHVIRVEDKRKFVPPTLEQAKDGIRAALQQQRRFELLAELSRKAKVEQ
jgi:peptidyl-prolyl cis-trans isomerase C